MMGLGGANCLGTHARTYGSCVEKYYISNFVWIGGHLYNGFTDRSLVMRCMCLYSLTSIVGSLIEYFLKYSSCITSIFQVKARYPRMNDDDNISKDHGICIG